ncbi:hypothetical protein D1872_245710 [compost metagenome]
MFLPVGIVKVSFIGSALPLEPFLNFLILFGEIKNAPILVQPLKRLGILILVEIIQLLLYPKLLPFLLLQRNQFTQQPLLQQGDAVGHTDGGIIAVKLGLHPLGRNQVAIAEPDALEPHARLLQPLRIIPERLQEGGGRFILNALDPGLIPLAGMFRQNVFDLVEGVLQPKRMAQPVVEVLLKGRLLHVLFPQLREHRGDIAVEHRIRREKNDLIRL